MPPQLRVLQHEYAFDTRLCECAKCELQPKSSTFVHSQRPKAWNGLMIVGEGPGVNEVKLQTPFVGPSGRLLDKVLEHAGVSREHVYVANATSCLPPPHDKALTKNFPNAVPSCRPRLMREIEFYRPRVILTLGAASLDALTGRFVSRKTKQKFTCETCAGALTLRCFECPSCMRQYLLHPEAQAFRARCECGWEGAPEVKKKRRPCPTCEGRKTRDVELHEWKTDHTVTHVSGGVFRGVDLGLPEGVEYVIPTYHPSHLLRKAETKAGKAFGGQFLVSAMIGHVQKAVRLLTEDADWKVALNRVSTPDQFEAWRAGLQAPDWIAADIETDSKGAFDVTAIKCVGLTAYYKDASRRCAADTVVCDTWLAEARAEGEHDAKLALIERLKTFLATSPYPFVWQNGIDYDSQVIWRMWGVEVRVDHDTMVGHHAIAPDEPHKLHHIVFTYTDAAPWKPPRTRDGVEVFEKPEDLFLYNARDVAGTAYAYEPMVREIQSEKAGFVYQLDMAKSVIAAGMSRVGLPVDVEMWASMRENWEQRERDAIAKLKAFAGNPEFNPNSTKQLQAFLFDPQGPCRFVPSGYTDTGQPSTDRPALLKLRGSGSGEAGARANEAIEVIFEWRRAKERVANYFGRFDEDGEQTTGMVVGVDGILRARWQPLGARTGRWSSAPLLMNWTKTSPADPKRGIPEIIGMRRVIRARPGRKFVGADAAQAELRFVALLSGDEALIRLCMNADEARKLEPECDPHSYVASFVFPNYVTLDLKDSVQKAIRKALRDVIKRVIYGLNYGAQADTVLEAIYDGGYEGPPIDLAMIKRAIDTYFKLFPGVKRFRESTLLEAQRTGYLFEALARRRRIFPLKDVPSTEAANFPIQAGTATLMDIAIIELVHALPKIDPTAYPFAQVHDAIYVDATEAHAPMVGELLEACMSCRVGLTAGGPTMDFIATHHISDTWDEAA